MYGYTVLKLWKQTLQGQPSIIRYELNLTPKAKTMLEHLVERVQTYSPQSDARVSEVFQGIMTLLHNAKDELELAELPRRGAWGSVTAKNFPGALGEAFERAILDSAHKRNGNLQNRVGAGLFGSQLNERRVCFNKLPAN